MTKDFWPDNPAEVDSFGLLNYYEINYARKVMREWKNSKDEFHKYEVLRAKKILENKGYDPDGYSPLLDKKKVLDKEE